MNHPEDFDKIVDAITSRGCCPVDITSRIQHWDTIVDFLHNVNRYYSPARIYTLMQDAESHLSKLRQESLEVHALESPRPDHKVAAKSPPDPLKLARETVLHTLNLLREATDLGLLKPCSDCDGTGYDRDGEAFSEPSPCHTCLQTGLVPIWPRPEDQAQ